MAAQKNVLDSCLQVLPSLQEDTTKLKVLNYLVGNLGDQGKFSQALAFGEQALKLADQLKAPKAKSNTYHYLGTVYRSMGNYPEAFKQFKESLRIREQLLDSNGIAKSYNVIGTIYSTQQDYEQAEWYLTKAIAILKTQNDAKSLSAALSNLASVYSTQEQYSKAFPLFQESLAIDLQRKDLKNAAVKYYNMGNMYNHQGKFSDALANFTKGFSIAQDTKNPILISNGEINIGSNWFHLKNFDSARFYIQEGLSLATSTGNIEDIKEAHHHLALVDSATGHYQEAFQHLKLFMQYRDSLSNEDNARKIMQTQFQYDFEKKEALANTQFQHQQDSLKRIHETEQLALQKEMQLKALRFEYARKQALAKSEKEKEALRYEEDIKRAQLNFEFQQKQLALEASQKEKDLIQVANQQKLQADFKVQQIQKDAKAKSQRNGLLAVFILAILLGSLYFLWYRQKQRLARKMEIESMKQRISRDLHDDIGSTLSSISKYAELANKKIGAQHPVSDMLSTMQTISKEMLLRMSDIVWSINPKHDSMEHLISRLENYCATVFTSPTTKHAIRVEEGVAELPLHSIQLKEIYLILKEAIHNALKYAQCQQVNLQFSKQKTYLLVQIEDDGIGFLPNETTVGMGGSGLQNMRDRAKELQGILEIKSLPKAGSTITLRIPIA